MLKSQVVAYFYVPLHIILSIGKDRSNFDNFLILQTEFCLRY